MHPSAWKVDSAKFVRLGGLPPRPRHSSSAYDTPRRKIANIATLETPSTRAATKASGPTSEGPPEVGSGLTVAGALGLAVAVAVGEVVAVLRTVFPSEVKT